MSADNSMRRAGASGGVVAYIIYAEVFVAACGLQLVLLLLLGSWLGLTLHRAQVGPLRSHYQRRHIITESVRGIGQGVRGFTSPHRAFRGDISEAIFPLRSIVSRQL